MVKFLAIVSWVFLILCLLNMKRTIFCREIRVLTVNIHFTQKFDKILEIYEHSKRISKLEFNSRISDNIILLRGLFFYKINYLSQFFDTLKLYNIKVIKCTTCSNSLNYFEFMQNPIEFDRAMTFYEKLEINSGKVSASKVFYNIKNISIMKKWKFIESLLNIIFHRNKNKFLFTLQKNNSENLLSNKIRGIYTKKCVKKKKNQFINFHIKYKKLSNELNYFENVLKLTLKVNLSAKFNRSDVRYTNKKVSTQDIRNNYMSLSIPNLPQKFWKQTENIGRNVRSAEISVNNLTKKIQLFIKNRFIQIMPDGMINGTQDESSDFTILQRTTVEVGQVKFQGIATCLYLCMNKCGSIFGSKQFTEDCIFNESMEEHHYNTYSSTYNSNSKLTLYLALNRHGEQRKLQIHPSRALGKLAAYTKSLTQSVSDERAQKLISKLFGQNRVKHGVHHLCENGKPIKKLTNDILRKPASCVSTSNIRKKSLFLTQERQYKMNINLKKIKTQSTKRKTFSYNNRTL